MSDIHMGGMVSGLDTENIIEKILSLEIEKIETKQEKRVDLEADVASWSSISSTMSGLTSSLDKLRSMDTWDQMSASVTDSSKMTASASSGAVEANYSIEISQLAKAHSVSSDTASDLGLADENTTLVGTVPGLNDGDVFKLGTGLNAQEIQIGSDDTLTTLAQKINTASASVDESERVDAVILDTGTSARLVVTRKNTGGDDIAFSEPDNPAQTPLQELGIFSASATYAAGNELIAAQQNQFSVNGVTMNRDNNSGITDAIPNATLDLLGTDTSGNLSLTISRDTATAKAAIEDFISKYNAAAAEMESSISVDLSDPKNPVTGPLQGDRLVSSILQNMRKLATELKSDYMDSTNASYTYNGNSGIMDSLDDIGLWTTGRSNRLSVNDSAKLDYMLDNHFDKVEQLFRGVNVENEGLRGGVARDLYDYSYSVSSSMTGEIDRRIEHLEDNISDYDVLLEKMYDDLDRQEERLWKDFEVMENAIASMQQETSWMVAQLGS